MKIALIVTVYAVSSSVGLALIKGAMNRVPGGEFFSLASSPGFWLGFFLYGLGFVIWFLILKQNNLSMIFPVAAGSLVIATALLGNVMLHEVITAKGIAGIALIVGGIVLLNMK